MLFARSVLLSRPARAALAIGLLMGVTAPAFAEDAPAAAADGADAPDIVVTGTREALR